MEVVQPLNQYQFCDIECFPNYFLVQLKDHNGAYKHVHMYGDQYLDKDLLREYLSEYPLITFNGNNYDIPMLMLALKGASTDELKAASDKIILGNLKPYQFYKHYGLGQPTFNHIDINEVTPGVMVSLKLYGGRIHMKKMQDLPYDPDNELTISEAQKVKDYCINDIETTEALFEKIKDRIELRRGMSYEYHTDLRSKSDAQVAEAVIKAELFRLSKKTLTKPSPKERVFFYKKPDYIQFKTSELQAILEMVLRSPFTAKTNNRIDMTDELADAAIKIGSSVYNLGIGGLHSQESCQAVIADEEYDIYDRDFTSYYPYIILVNKLYPETIGSKFLDVYSEIVERRLEHKKLARTSKDEEERKRAKAIEESLKITINGTFGKLGSVYSTLYAPDLMIQVTVTGQLTLLMLIEKLELAGISVVSANTDGIVIKCPKYKRKLMLDIISEFEQLTGYMTEETQYSAIFSRDVNNYIAIGIDGKVKTKGVFKESDLQKNPENDICKTAVIEYLKNGKPVEQTIKSCDDITKFVSVRTVKGGGMYADQYLGKVVRWYYSNNSNGVIYYKSSGNKVPRTDGASPIMDLPDSIPADINYDWYINECNELLMDLGVVERPMVVKRTRKKAA